MRTIVIGDVHGCLEELKELLNLAGQTFDDHLVFIGDLIDRGPKAADTVKFAADLADQCSVELITGNHEEKFLRWLKHVRNGSPAVQQMKGIEEFPDLLAELGEREISFLSSGWLSYHIPESQWLCVHGGIPGTIRTDLSISHRGEEYSARDGSGLDLLNKTRYLTPDGKFVSLGDEKPGWPYWAEVYDGRFGKVFFGHQPFMQPEPVIFPNAVALDTGCVYGGWLTASILERGGNPRYISVKARRQYAEKIRIKPI